MPLVSRVLRDPGIESAYDIPVSRHCSETWGNPYQRPVQLSFVTHFKFSQRLL